MTSVSDRTVAVIKRYGRNQLNYPVEARYVTVEELRRVVADRHALRRYRR